jgi:heat shock protein HslJ
MRKLMTIPVLILMLALMITSPACNKVENGDSSSATIPTASNEQSSGEDDAIRRDAEMYAELEGVSVDEAIERFELMNDAIVENEEAYAGSWIQHQPEYQFVFAFTENGEEIIAKYVKEDSPLAGKIKILTFKYSYKELEEIRDSITSLMESRGVYSYTDIDMQNNRIDFRFYDKESADEVIRQDESEIPDCVNILQYEGLEIPDSLLTDEDRAIDRSNKDELNWSQWWAVTVNGTDVYPETIISMFAKYDGTVIGTAGCNRYWNYYNTKGPYIRISGAGKNNMGCPEEILEQEDTFLKCLRNSDTFIIEGDSLTLCNASGRVLVIFERRPEYPMNPEDLIGTSWKLVYVDGEPVSENKTGTLIFDEDGVSLHGLGSVTKYEYSYEARGDDIVFTSIITERIRDSSGKLAHGRPSAIIYISPIVSYRLINGQLEIYTEGKMTLIFEPFESPEGG